MDRNAEIAASLRRLAALQIEVVAREAFATVAKSSRKGTLYSGNHVQTVRRVCVEGFRGLSTAAAVQIAEIEGDEAPKRADCLDEILRDAGAEILGKFASWAAPGRASPLMTNLAASEGKELQREIDETREGTVADLRLGIAGGLNVRKHKEGVLIDNRGGAGQFVLNSTGVSQSGNQTATTGIDVASLLDLLRLVREDAAKASLSPEARDTIEDAIVNAEREIKAASPDVSRVKRLLDAVGTMARDFGINLGAAWAWEKISPLLGGGA